MFVSIILIKTNQNTELWFGTRQDQNELTSVIDECIWYELSGHLTK